MNQHAGDCTIYASLSNGCPTDGICTCGYAGYKDRSQNVAMHDLYSEERLIEMKNRPQPNAGESMSFAEAYWNLYRREPFNDRFVDTVKSYAMRDGWELRDFQVYNLRTEIESLKAKLKVAREALEGLHNLIPKTAWHKLDQFSKALAVIDEKGNV